MKRASSKAVITLLAIIFFTFSLLPRTICTAESDDAILLDKSHERLKALDLRYKFDRDSKDRTLSPENPIHACMVFSLSENNTVTVDYYSDIANPSEQESTFRHWRDNGLAYNHVSDKGENMGLIGTKEQKYDSHRKSVKALEDAMKSKISPFKKVYLSFDDQFIEYTYDIDLHVDLTSILTEELHENEDISVEDKNRIQGWLDASVMSVVLGFPGESINNNADRVVEMDGLTYYIWSINFNSSRNLVLQAKNTNPGKLAELNKVKNKRIIYGASSGALFTAFIISLAAMLIASYRRKKAVKPIDSGELGASQ